jgi:hypothetical protein
LPASWLDELKKSSIIQNTSSKDTSIKTTKANSTTKDFSKRLFSLKEKNPEILYQAAQIARESFK